MNMLVITITWVYTIISADGENWKMLEQLKDESGKVVTANLNGVCAMP